jgi:hypothetical protein
MDNNVTKPLISSIEIKLVHYGRAIFLIAWRTWCVHYNKVYFRHLVCEADTKLSQGIRAKMSDSIPQLWDVVKI